MATYLDLKQRIITDMARDDLEDDLADALTTHISRAIEYYQGERFWFNYGSVSATASAAVVSMPATMRVIDKVVLADGTVLQKRPLADMLGSTLEGTPSHYAEYGDGIYLYPAPGSSITITLYGVTYETPPTGDSDVGVWVNEAQDLIAAHTRFTLCRDALRDPEGATMAKGAVTDAFDRLMQETARRNDTPLRVPSHFPTTGYSWFSY